ncbi:hypothetical protein J3R82DRAFT_1374 [Butyriboletus roseoflavus]|nr:hypothetical protein J3R82DRAFT_1374 [Butyriboletus roseoflavus]
MRYFVETVARRPLGSPVFECFESVLRKRTQCLRISSFRRGRYLCHHFTFTPTPAAFGSYQSNRVIREYKGYEDHFLRVEFGNEDRLQYSGMPMGSGRQ